MDFAFITEFSPYVLVAILVSFDFAFITEYFSYVLVAILASFVCGTATHVLVNGLRLLDGCPVVMWTFGWI